MRGPRALPRLLLAASPAPGAAAWARGGAGGGAGALRCADSGESSDSAQLFQVDVELLGDSGRVIFASNTAAGGSARKICYRYPFAEEHLGAKFEDAWASFRDLATVQFVLPASLADSGVMSIRVLAPQGRTPLTPTNGFSSYYRDQYNQSRVASTSDESWWEVEILVNNEDWHPAHISLFENPAPGEQQTGASLMAVWVSFAQPDAAYDCANYDHCCNITSDIAGGLSQDTCDIGDVKWECFTGDGEKWQDGQAVGYVNFMGSLVNSNMAGGQKSVLIHLDAAADVSVPLSNSYAEHPVHDSSACRALCSTLQSHPKINLFDDPNATACKLSGKPNIRAKAGYGAITINGFGRINGREMMRKFFFQDSTDSLWANPDSGFTNAYGNMVDTFVSVADAESHTRWRLMSGLVELSSAGAGPFAIDMSGVAVAWGGKRGDGTVRLQFPRVALDGGHSVEDSNKPARMFDVKTPGTWVGASDGPRVTADGSWLGNLFLMHADDNLKVDSSAATYRHITLLQGNIGDAIELGTYGIGLRGNRVEHVSVDGIYIHRITHSHQQEDDLGSVLGSRTCPVGIILSNITLANVHIPSVGGANQISSLFALGTYGAPSSQYKRYSPLDRWFFCVNPWWLGQGQPGSPAGGTKGNSIQESGSAAVFKGIRFLNWRVYPKEQAKSLLFNFHDNASTTMDGIDFYAGYDPDPKTNGGFPWTRGVRLFGGASDEAPASDFRTPCLGNWAGDPSGEECWMSTQSGGAAYQGPILGRAAEVCDAVGELRRAAAADCNTFQVVGSKSTTWTNVRFPFGNHTNVLQ